NWPSSLSPQHWTYFGFKAQVCCPPAVIVFIPLVSPTTSAGVLLLIAVPSPTCPSWFFPQHLTPPPVVKTQLCRPPAVIAPGPLAVLFFPSRRPSLLVGRARCPPISGHLAWSRHRCAVPRL